MDVVISNAHGRGLTFFSSAASQELFSFVRKSVKLSGLELRGIKKDGIFKLSFFFVGEEPPPFFKSFVGYFHSEMKYILNTNTPMTPVEDD